MADKSTQWLRELKHGDEVILSQGFSSTTYTLVKVERLTKTQLVLQNEHRRFNLDTGREVGADSYIRTHIHQATPHLRSKWDHQQLRNWLASLPAKSLSLEALRSMQEAWKKHQADTTEQR